MEIKNAIIESVTITNEDHGILSIYLHLSYGGSGQSFGGYVLYSPTKWRVDNNYCGHFIWRVMQIAGVGNWEQLIGKTIRVKSNNMKIQAIGHILKDDWFDPEQDFKNGDN